MGRDRRSPIDDEAPPEGGSRVRGFFRLHPGLEQTSIPESVKNGETGIVALGYFKEEVAEALARLLSLSPEARAAMGEWARQFTLARHHAQVAGERYREVLAQAMVGTRVVQ